MQFAVKLTARQQQILDLIRSTIAQTGAPPTRAEIAAELGFKSANAAEEHLQALARKGAIELLSGTSRGIRLKGDALRSLNESRDNQFSLSLPGMAQLALPLVGRVAAGSPILAQEHVDQTYYVENTLFQHQPDYLLKVIAEDLPSYQRFYDSELTSLPGVERLTSTLVMKNLKANAGPPV